MRPSQLLTIVFAALAGAAVLLAGAGIWTFMSSGAQAGEQAILLLGAAGLAIFLFALTGGWAVLHLRLIRPIEAVTREMGILSHAKKMRQIEIPDGHCTGELTDALHDLIAKFIAARQETEHAVAAATHRSQTFNRRLEAILLDLSEGVIVCNLDNRILLYNQAAMRLLRCPAELGLGRRLFGLFERDSILGAVEDLLARQRADTNRKLRARRAIECRMLDGSIALEARMALICSDEIEAEGYVLTFAGSDVEEEQEDTLPPRPEFYDFDLFRREPAREITEIPLKELRCVVFDTETTGLNPSEGDELLSIGAVRIVNSRIVTGETFEQLINPRKAIPRKSIKFHGITDKDVNGMPSADLVLPRFHRFIGRSVLVAHNAAFDMKFLQMKEKESGVSFTSPVLDVLLLSAFLHDHAEDHSLDATAQRLGVDVSGRHTALGDAMTTARIFLAMLDPLHEAGVEALGDAFDVSNRMVEIRKQQAHF